MSKAQNKNVSTVVGLAPSLAALRLRLCPSYDGIQTSAKVPIH